MEEKFKTSYEKQKALKKIIEAKEKIYENLTDLEYDGMFGTKEYLDEIRKLKNIDDAFIEVSSELKISNADNMNACSYIKNELFGIDATDIDSLIYKIDDTSNRVLFNYLFNKSIDIFGIPTSIIENYLLKEFYNLKYKVFDDNRQVELGRYVYEDINRTFLTFLQEAIEEPKNEDVKDELLEAKYKLIYMNEYLEEEMINNNFEIDHIVPVKSRLMCNLLDASEDEVIIVFSYILLDNIKENKKYILELPNEEHESSKYELILRSCYIRANLFFMEKESILEESVDYRSEISKRDIRYDHLESDKVIKDSFTKALRDKKRYRPLS